MFAQLYYLYTSLRPHRPMLLYQQLKYHEPSTVTSSNRIIRNPAEHQQMQAISLSSNRKRSSPSWDMRYHASRRSRKHKTAPRGSQTNTTYQYNPVSPGSSNHAHANNKQSLKHEAKTRQSPETKRGRTHHGRGLDTWHVAWRQTVSVRCPWQIEPGGCVVIVVKCYNNSIPS